MSNVLNKITLAALLALISAPVYAAEETYTLDKSHTNILWSANHMGFSNVYGKFADMEGKLVLDEAAPQNSKVSVTIKMASVTTGIEKFDAHLKGKDFFDVEAFPAATYESTKVEITEAGKKAKVTGNLTLHGITKPVTLDVTLNKIGLNTFSNKKTAGFSASGVIKRSDFGISYALPAVPDEVKLVIESESSI